MSKSGCENKSALLNFKWDWLLRSDQTKKMSFLAANTQDGFGEHRDNKYPTCTVKYTAVFFYVVGLYILL